MTHPQAILPDAKAVVVISVKYPMRPSTGGASLPPSLCFFTRASRFT